ncbi:hypothetical protein R3P82_12785 [Dietzia maris]|uniref:Uncharacterized protein n=1 Tax=Dietzia maris TaxID=37915 RepID=A0AAE4QX64_9ACTN|nr:hypothetical protein [Dietzia maris]MDV6299986.1 hypothetical protein [Dietzia maris]
MTTHTRDARPLPAPLPYASQAGRGEIPVPPPAAPAVPEDPDAPLFREDDATAIVCTVFVVTFVAVMVIIAMLGGL